MSDDSKRPPIPAEIRRAVLVEAGHRCAIPQCRHIEVEVHHIIPWAECKAHEYDNLIALCPNCHRMCRPGGSIDRKSARLYKANLRFLHDKFSHVEVDVLFALHPNKTLQWPKPMIILLNRIDEAGFIQEAPNTSGVVFTARHGDLDVSPIRIMLTPKGRQYVSDLSRREL